MARIINGQLYVSSYEPTGNPGEYTFTDAVFSNQADASGSGALDIQVGFIVYVPIADILSFSPIPGFCHRYRITNISSSSYSNISATILWDEVGSEIDTPISGSYAIISERTSNLGLGLPASMDVYANIPGGITENARDVDLKYIIDNISGGGSSSTGIQGLTGIQGSTGIYGLTGILGIDGQTGIQGLTGILGIDGQTGIQGFTGIRGLTGLTLGGAVYYLHNETSDATSSYKLLSRTLPEVTESIAQVTIKNTTSPQLLGVWCTVAGDPGIQVPGGVRTYKFWESMSTAGGDTNFAAQMFKRDSSGNEIFLADSTSGNLMGVAADWNLSTWDITILSPGTFGPTDRFVQKIWAMTTATSNKVVSLSYEDQTHASYIETPISIGMVGSQGRTGIQGVTGILGIDGQTGIQGLTGLALGATGVQVKTGVLSFSISSAIGSCPTGIMGQTTLPGNTAFNTWTIFTDTTSSINLDVRKSSYANYPDTTGLHGTTGLFILSGIKNTGITDYWSGQTGASGDLIRVILAGSDGSASKISLNLGYSLF
jgi:hypothetical protein